MEKTVNQDWEPLEAMLMTDEWDHVRYLIGTYIKDLQKLSVKEIGLDRVTFFPLFESSAREALAKGEGPRTDAARLALESIEALRPLLHTRKDVTLYLRSMEMFVNLLRATIFMHEKFNN